MSGTRRVFPESFKRAAIDRATARGLSAGARCASASRIRGSCVRDPRADGAARLVRPAMGIGRDEAGGLPQWAVADLLQTSIIRARPGSRPLEREGIRRSSQTSRPFRLCSNSDSD